MTDEVMCVRCGEVQARNDLDGMCGHCHWAIRTEVELGLVKLQERLGRYAEFDAWLREHPDAA